MCSPPGGARVLGWERLRERGSTYREAIIPAKSRLSRYKPNGVRSIHTPVSNTSPLTLGKANKFIGSPEETLVASHLHFVIGTLAEVQTLLMSAPGKEFYHRPTQL